jgi:hypothetical protein
MMRTTRWALMGWLGVLALSACSDSGPVLPDGHSDARRDGPLSEARSPDTLPDTLAADTGAAARICGTLLDEAGAAVEGVGIDICKDEIGCASGSSGSGGVFCVSVREPSEYSFRTSEKILSGKHYGFVLFPLTVGSAEVTGRAKIDLGDLVLPVIGTTVAVDTQTSGTLSLGGGASLTVAAGSVVLPVLKSVANVGLAAIPVGKVHPRLLQSRAGAPDPAAVFLLVPAGLTFTTPAAFVFPGAGLSSGTALDIYAANDKTGKLEAHGEATVDAQGKIVDSGGKGLRATGWLTLYKK